MRMRSQESLSPGTLQMMRHLRPVVGPRGLLSRPLRLTFFLFWTMLLASCREQAEPPTQRPCAGAGDTVAIKCTPVDSLSPAGDTLTKFGFFFEVWQRFGKSQAGVVRANCFASLTSPFDVVAIGQRVSYGDVMREVWIRGDGRVEYRWSANGPGFHEAYGNLDAYFLEAIMRFAEDLDVDCLPDWSSGASPNLHGEGTLTVVARGDVQNVFFIAGPGDRVPGRLLAIEPFLEIVLRRTEWQVKSEGPIDLSFHHY